MVDLHSILATHHSKQAPSEKVGSDPTPKDGSPSYSEIPDIFFENIMVDFKLSRTEIMVLLYLYRQVWCKANLYREYGITQVLSHTEIAKNLKVTIDDVYYALRKLEDMKFIETIRSGQYFVRKYFTEELDEKFGHNYDDF